jgi:hypothetical protein
MEEHSAITPDLKECVARLKGIQECFDGPLRVSQPEIISDLEMAAVYIQHALDLFEERKMR